MSESSSAPFVVAAIYKFVTLIELESRRESLLEFCQGQNLQGTLLLAREGINGTVAGSRQAVDALRTYLAETLGLDGVEWKEASSEMQPFLRLKVRLKNEIVTMGVPDIDPNRLVGTYVEPEDWNQLISDPDVMLIDTRNRYEYHLGTFEGAIDPQTDSFREFPAYAEQHLDQREQKKVAMFCTGGIRCEKATAYLKQQGFEQVYHLKGGILKYLETVPKQDSLWRGECFVFDDRVTLDHDLKPSAREVCPNCRMPVTEEDKQLPEYEQNVSCQYCFDTVTEQRRASLKERQKQRTLAAARGEKHWTQERQR